jgi:hypothetical protein
VALAAQGQAQGLARLNTRHGLKPLRVEGEQETIPLEELADRVDAWLYGDDEQLIED